MVCISINVRILADSGKMGMVCVSINVRILADSGKIGMLCVFYKCANPSGFNQLTINILTQVLPPQYF